MPFPSLAVIAPRFCRLSLPASCLHSAALPASAESAIEVARRAAQGKTGHLNLGFTGTSAVHPMVPMAIRTFRQNYPGVELQLEEANSIRLVEGLLEGRLDVAVLRPHVAQRCVASRTQAFDSLPDELPHVGQL